MSDEKRAAILGKESQGQSVGWIRVAAGSDGIVGQETRPEGIAVHKKKDGIGRLTRLSGHGAFEGHAQVSALHRSLVIRLIDKRLACLPIYILSAMGPREQRGIQ
jgi:hypothetical protein